MTLRSSIAARILACLAVALLAAQGMIHPDCPSCKVTAGYSCACAATSPRPMSPRSGCRKSCRCHARKASHKLVTAKNVRSQTRIARVGKTQYPGRSACTCKDKTNQQTTVPQPAQDGLALDGACNLESTAFVAPSLGSGQDGLPDALEHHAWYAPQLRISLCRLII